MKRFFAVLLAAMLICGIAGSALADDKHPEPFESVIKFKEKQDTYGPSTSGYYHKKNNNGYDWSATYVSGWNNMTSVYLYDQQYGDRATHIIDVDRGTTTGAQVFLNSKCCVSSHYYKIVAKRDISKYSDPYNFVYNWGL